MANGAEGSAIDLLASNTARCGRMRDLLQREPGRSLPLTLRPPDEWKESLGGSHGPPQVHFSYLHVGVHAGEFNFPKCGDPSIVNQPPETYKTKSSTISRTNRLLTHTTELFITTCDGEDQIEESPEHTSVS